MIGWIEGTLREKHPPHLLVIVNGVGYELEAPMTTFYTLPGVGESVKLYIHQVVREDAHHLYGFSVRRDRAERFVGGAGIVAKHMRSLGA